jgi:hypothetical protein
VLKMKKGVRMMTKAETTVSISHFAKSILRELAQATKRNQTEALELILQSYIVEPQIISVRGIPFSLIKSLAQKAVTATIEKKITADVIEFAGWKIFVLPDSVRLESENNSVWIAFQRLKKDIFQLIISSDAVSLSGLIYEPVLAELLDRLAQSEHHKRF